MSEKDDIDRFAAQFAQGTPGFSALATAYGLERRPDEELIDYRARMIEALTPKPPRRPGDVIIDICRGRDFEAREDQASLTFDLTCADLTEEEARQIAGSFTIQWRVRINGRSAWEILK